MLREACHAIDLPGVAPALPFKAMYALCISNAIARGRALPHEEGRRSTIYWAAMGAVSIADRCSSSNRSCGRRWPRCRLGEELPAWPLCGAKGLSV